MNKREFKKSVQAVGDVAVAQIVDITESNDKIDKAKASNAVEKVISAVAAAKTNADITFDKGVKAFENLKEYSKAKKAFFRQLFTKINEDFVKDLDEAVKEFNEAVPEELKQENKSTVK